MTTKILSNPFPPDDDSKKNQQVAKPFNLNDRKVPLQQDASSSSELARNASSEELSGTLGLYVVARNIELVVDLRDFNYIGRSYPRTGSFDGIDFSAFDAYTLGVSRQHAILKRDKDRLFIIDNNSSNGTYLNRAMLQPLQPYLIKHDDNIRLGAFDLVIKLDEQAQQ